jgi:hypothetical protein
MASNSMAGCIEQKLSAGGDGSNRRLRGMFENKLAVVPPRRQTAAFDKLLQTDAKDLPQDPFLRAFRASVSAWQGPIEQTCDLGRVPDPAPNLQACHVKCEREGNLRDAIRASPAANQAAEVQEHFLQQVQR